MTLTTTSVDSCWAESLPYNGLANVGGNEKGNTRPQTVAFLQKFIQQQDDKSGTEELKDDQHADTSTKVGWVTVHACHDVHSSLTNCDHHSKHCVKKRQEQQYTMRCGHA